MALFNAFNISASGMTAQRLRTDVLSQNIANVNTTRTSDGTPYRRQNVIFTEKDATPFAKILSMSKAGPIANQVGSGVKVAQITEDNETPMNMVYDPSHPDSDENGYVTYPNVNIITEMTDLIDATRAYESNVTAFNSSKSMALKGLEIGR